MLIDSKFSTLVCALVYARYDGLSTQLPVGIAEGLKRESSIHCDELVSLPKAALRRFVGSREPATLQKLDLALLVALAREPR